MKETFTAAVLGVGSRGFTYIRIMEETGHFNVVSLCDRNPAQIDKATALLHLPRENLFFDEDRFFEKKRADVLVIATYDKDHVRHCLKALRLGYDVLLEKPVSDSEEELKMLLETQEKTGKKVVVCHVLRYSAPFIKVGQLLREGAIGRLIAIDALDRVRYWHYAQAYTRIQSTMNDVTHPTLLAKCCHDLDYIQHYAAAPCDTVSSIGGLCFFREENAPEGSAERCLDCDFADSCLYSAKRLYLDSWKNAGRPAFAWPYSKLTLSNPMTEQDLCEALRNTHFGKCVFRCGIEQNPDVVDHQMVQMRFANGIIAHLKMLFTAEPGGRRLTLFGTEGEIALEPGSDRIELRRLGQQPQTISANELTEGGNGGYGHGGGDEGMIWDLYRILRGEKREYTSLRESLESHQIGIKAEESRKNGGITLSVHAGRRM